MLILELYVISTVYCIKEYDDDDDDDDDDDNTLQSATRLQTGGRTDGRHHVPIADHIQCTKTYYIPLQLNTIIVLLVIMMCANKSKHTHYYNVLRSHVTFP